VSFSRAIDFSLRWEGGYVHDPADLGGETNHGISKRAHPDVDIQALTVDGARAIYGEAYWPDTGGQLTPETQGAGALAAALFDFGIHSGTSRAVRELQQLVAVRTDGVLGPITRRAIQAKANDLLALALVERRGQFLERLVQAKPELGRFEKGWRLRLAALVRCIQGRDFA
tara:strand:- start:537 stop:1049 length:513 start_codon:yes stop_codon:yes gene_type:complete